MSFTLPPFPIRGPLDPRLLSVLDTALSVRKAAVTQVGSPTPKVVDLVSLVGVRELKSFLIKFPLHCQREIDEVYSL